MYLAIIIPVLLNTGMFALVAFFTRKDERLNNRRCFLTSISIRMRHHQRKIEQEERQTIGEPGHYARIRKEKIEARMEELNEIAKLV